MNTEEQNLNIEFIEQEPRTISLGFKVKVENDPTPYFIQHSFCVTFEEAKDFFFKHFFKKYHRNRKIQIYHDTISEEKMNAMSQAC